MYGAPVPGGLVCVEQTQIQKRPIRIVSEEVFIAMATAAHRRSQSCVHDPLKSLRHVFGGLAYLDSAHAIRRRCRPAKVMSLSQRVVTRILSKNGNCHIAPMPTRRITTAGTKYILSIGISFHFRLIIA